MAELVLPVYGGMFDSTTVVETVGGFPRGDKAVDSAFFAKMIECFYKDGVSGEDSFAVVPAGGYTIEVSAGIAWIRGYMAWQKSAQSVTLTPGLTYSIMLRLNVPAGEFTLVATDGGATDNESIRDLVLAEITIPSSANAVTADMITDTRSDRNKCGIVTSAVDALAAVGLAENANMLGGVAAGNYMLRSGGAMLGDLRAAADNTGRQVVRNIGYGTTLPDTLADGELFILLSVD